MSDYYGICLRLFDRWKIAIPKGKEVGLYNHRRSSSDFVLHTQKKMVSQSLDAVVDLFNSSVDLNQKSLTISLLAIAFNPTAWNIVARNGAGPIV